MTNRRLPAALAGFAMIAASSQPAWADDWQYCLASSYAEHKVYISAAINGRGSADARAAFERALADAGFRHDIVQCPRADNERSIEEMIRYAVSFNRQSGNTIVYLPSGSGR